MNNRDIAKDTEAVIRRAMKLVRRHITIGKHEFVTINDLIIQSVEKNTGISRLKILQRMDKVLEDLPNEYGRLDEEMKSWEALVAYLYAKYLKELGVLPN